MLQKTTDQCGDNWDLEIPSVQFHYMNHDHSATTYSPFYLSYGYHPRTPQLVLAPLATKRQQTAHQWASTLLWCMLPPPLPRPRYPTKLQSCWQGPYIVVKCLKGNTYHIKLAKIFWKKLLQHHGQLCVHTHPERLQPACGENPTDAPTVVPTTVSVPLPSSQVEVRVIREDIPFTRHTNQSFSCPPDWHCCTKYTYCSLKERKHSWIMPNVTFGTLSRGEVTQAYPKIWRLYTELFGWWHWCLLYTVTHS